MSKRAPLTLGEFVRPKAGSEDRQGDDVTPPEPTAVIYIRAPWSLAQELHDEARRQTKRQGRKVDANSLAIEALRRFLKA